MVWTGQIRINPDFPGIILKITDKVYPGYGKVLFIHKKTCLSIHLTFSTKTGKSPQISIQNIQRQNHENKPSNP